MRGFMVCCGGIQLQFEGLLYTLVGKVSNSTMELR